MESSAETESNVDRFAGPEGQVKGSEVFFREIIPSVIGARGEETVVDDVLRCSTPCVLLEHAVVVKSTPNGGSRRTGAFQGGLLRATDEVPSRFFTSNLDDGQIIPNITDDEARAVGVSERTKSEMAEEFDAHKGTIGAGQIDIVEDHSVVPVLSIPAPFVSGAVRFHVSSPHEVGWVEVVG